MKNSEFYDGAYFESHYQHVCDSDSYYILLGKYWKYVVTEALGYEPALPMLDYGAGPGHISAAFDADCYDFSPEAVRLLELKHRKILSDLKSRSGHYQTVICSHCLEHCESPMAVLREIKALLAPGGQLLLILPCEKTPGPIVEQPDNNRHLFTWNFQLLANLADASGYNVSRQTMVYANFGLKLFNKLAPSRAAMLANFVGKTKGNYRSFFSAWQKPV
jgi:SAM-dependent methyltransferase